MLETKLIMQWDDVIADIISFVFDKSKENQPELLKNIVLLPIKELVQTANNSLLKLFEQPTDYILWTDVIEQLLLFVYIGSLFYFGILLLIELTKIISKQTFLTEIKATTLKPLQRFFWLQCLHFIVMPIIIQIITIYPRMIKSLQTIFQQGISIEPSQLIFAITTEETLLLEVILSILFMVLLLLLLIQFLKQGLEITFAFTKCYWNLLFVQEVVQIFQPIKEVIMRIWIIYSFQLIIFYEMIQKNQKVISIKQLLDCVTLLTCAVLLPKTFFRKR